MIEPCVFADEVSKEFDEAARLCAANGARAIELRGGIWHKSVQDATDDDVKRLQDVLAKLGTIRIGVIGSPVGKCSMFNDEECAKHTKWLARMVELAETFGARVIRGFTFWDPTGSYEKPLVRDGLEKNLKKVMERMKVFLKVLEGHDVTYGVETEWVTGVGTAQEWRRLYDELGQPKQLSITWDLNNAQTIGEEPLRDYRFIRGHVSHLHVKPNADKKIKTVGTSKTSYAQVFRALLADGYSGTAGIEHWGSPELMLEGVRQLVATLKEVQGEG